jgi:hypothetical protein
MLDTPSRALLLSLYAGVRTGMGTQGRFSCERVVDRPRPEPRLARHLDAATLHFVTPLL